MAAVAPGSLAILDEPTNDVDPVRRRHLWREVRALAQRGTTVLLVTHNVIEAERSVDRLAILDHGRVVAQGTPAELKTSTADELRLDLTLEPGARPPAIPAVRIAGDPCRLAARRHGARERGERGGRVGDRRASRRPGRGVLARTGNP